MSSSIPATLAALAALGQANLPTGWQVINGPASSVTTLEDRVLVVGETVEGTRTLDSMTFTTCAEEFRVQIDFSVSLAGTDQTAADAVAFAGYAAFESALRTTENLAAGVLQALMLGDFVVTRQSSGQGRGTHIRAAVTIYAQQT